MTPNSWLTECEKRASEDGLHLSVQKWSHVWTGRTTTSSARLRARTWGGIRRIVKGRNGISGSCQNSTVLVRNLLIRCRSDLWSTVLSYKNGPLNIYPNTFSIWVPSWDHKLSIDHIAYDHISGLQCTAFSANILVPNFFTK